MLRWRGVPSHFNNATPFDIWVFIVMGLLVGIAAMGIIVVTVRSFARLPADPGMVLAIRTGLVLLVAGQVLGGLIANNGAQVLAADADGLAVVSVFGAAGQMKLPHAVALHAVQVLPLLAWLLSLTAPAQRARIRLVAVACAGYVGLLGVDVLQTFRGYAPLSVDAAALLVLLVSAGLLAWAGAATLLNLARWAVPAAVGRGAAAAVPRRSTDRHHEAHDHHA